MRTETFAKLIAGSIAMTHGLTIEFDEEYVYLYSDQFITGDVMNIVTGLAFKNDYGCYAEISSTHANSIVIVFKRAYIQHFDPS